MTARAAISRDVERLGHSPDRYVERGVRPRACARCRGVIDDDISLVAGADDPIDVLGDAMETSKAVLSGLAYPGFIILGFFNGAP